MTGNVLNPDYLNITAEYPAKSAKAEALKEEEQKLQVQQGQTSSQDL